MPEGRGRSGRGQDAVVQQTPWASRQGEPGNVVKDGPPIRECGRGTDNWNQGGRAPRVEAGITGLRNAAINPSNFVIPSGRRRDGRGQEEVVLNRGLRLHARVIPAAFPSGKACHISGAVDVNGEWTWISATAGPRRGEQGITGNLTRRSNRETWSSLRQGPPAATLDPSS